jgi:hypothetical protein
MSGYIGARAPGVSSGTENKKKFSITGTTTSLTGLIYNTGRVHVFHNGVRLVDGTDYTATDGATITLTTAAESGDEVVVISQASLQIADVLPLAGGDLTGDLSVDGIISTTNGADIDMDGTASGQLKLDGNGYGGAIALNAQGMNIYTNSANRDILFGTNETEAMRIDGSGNVGIGTDSPSDVLHVVTPSFGGITLECTGATADPTFKFLGASTNYWSLQQDVSDSDSFQFRYNNSEKARMDSSGNLLVGKTAIDNTTVGFRFNGSSGFASFVRSGGEPLYLNRNTSFGEIVKFAKDGSTKGSITIPATDNFAFIGENGNVSIGAADTGLIISSAESIRPFNPSTNASRDNAIGLGESYARFVDVWAVDGSINTSDENEKQDKASLTTTEMLVGKRISGLFKTFRWIDAVAKKGDDARTHTGTMAQEVQAAFTAEGLDASEYGMFISSTWWEHDVPVPAVEAGEDVEAKDAYTRTDIYDTEAEAPEGATERTRLGIRYHELLCFVSAYNEQRFATLEVNQTAIEARLTALEAV